MRVDPTHGCCCTCDGELEIIDADYASMTVQCVRCGDSYLVEPDAFGDGGMIYYVSFMADWFTIPPLDDSESTPFEWSVDDE